MRWVLDQPGVAAIIVGVRHAGHLPAASSALGLQLEQQDRDAIASVQADSQGPDGEVYELERLKGGVHASLMKYTLNRSG